MDDRFKLIEKLGELSAKAYMFGRMYNIDAVTELTKDINELIAKVFGYSPWHTGTPTEEGWYLVAFNFHEGEIRYETWYYPNKLTWDNNNFGLLAWQRIEPPQEYDT